MGASSPPGHLSWLPLAWRLRLLFVAHQLLAPRGGRVRLRVARAAPGWTVDDGRRTIHVPSFARWVRYGHGVAAACDQVAAVYRIGHEIEVGAGDVVIDVGANVGEVSLACAAAGAVVHAVEADPVTFELLSRNVEGVAGITRWSFAAADGDGTLTFYRSAAGADGSLVEPEAVEEVIEVPARRLDAFADELGISWCHLLKCDAEGAEPEVLRGASSLLARTTWVSVDCSPERQGEGTVDECVDLLTAAGFEASVFRVVHGREIVVGRRGRRPDPGS